MNQEISNGQFFVFLDDNFVTLSTSNAMYRNNQKWDIEAENQYEIDCIKAWLVNRIGFLDEYINSNY